MYRDIVSTVKEVKEGGRRNGQMPRRPKTQSEKTAGKPTREKVKVSAVTKVQLCTKYFCGFVSNHWSKVR